MAKRMDNEVNASSMADIAFLLLVFFLVTTTMNPDTGITVKLPPWSEDDAQEVKLNKRNVFAVLVNANNDLLVRGEPEDITSLRERAKEFIANPSHREDL
ncbi:MAG TPA: biopolymer transporter ExbD, partial [Saprospiraceae bacterium]|nr:biopolymer transporter ExbD [Saprospiraceae bacterium]